MDQRELAAQLAEAVRESLKPDLLELKSELANVASRMDSLESRMDNLESRMDQLEDEVKELRQDVNRLTDKMDEVATTNAFLVKDVYMLRTGRDKQQRRSLSGTDCGVWQLITGVEEATRCMFPVWQDGFLSWS